MDDVLIDASRKIITYEGSLDVLAYAQATRTKGSDLPSWVADWRYAVYPGWPACRPIFDSPLLKGTGADVSFYADNKGREGRVLADELSYSHFKCGPVLTFRTARGHDICTTVLAEEGDDVWMLYGAKNLFVLRPKGRHYSLVCGRMDDGADCSSAIREATNLVESQEVEIRLIDIY